MSARSCQNCGAVLPSGAQFCSYCGTSVTAPPAAPSEGPSPRPPMTPLPSTYAPPPPPPRRSRARLVFVLFVVVILVVGGAIVAVAFLPSASTNQVEIQEFDVWAPDNACGLDANPIGFTGFNDTLGDTDQLQLRMPNYNTTPCVIAGLATNTSGFAVSNLSLPLTVPGSSDPGNPVNESLNLTLAVPDAPFDGVVDLVIR